MDKEKYGVLMIDVSDDEPTRRQAALDAIRTITKAYPEMAGHILVYPEDSHGKYGRIAQVIAAFDMADILYCNTCGDEIDHLYRFVRAIAHSAGLEIVPVKDILQKEESD